MKDRKRQSYLMIMNTLRFVASNSPRPSPLHIFVDFGVQVLPAQQASCNTVFVGFDRAYICGYNTHGSIFAAECKDS